jgi:hypothetical protein
MFVLKLSPNCLSYGVLIMTKGCGHLVEWVREQIYVVLNYY